MLHPTQELEPPANPARFTCCGRSRIRPRRSSCVSREGLGIYTVELYRKVRLDCADGMSKRAAARQFDISRGTVNKIMAFSVSPGYRREKPITRPKLDGFTEVIDGWLDGDRGCRASNAIPRSGLLIGWAQGMISKAATRSSRTMCASVGVNSHALSGAALRENRWIKPIEPDFSDQSARSAGTRRTRPNMRCADGATWARSRPAINTQGLIWMCDRGIVRAGRG